MDPIWNLAFRCGDGDGDGETLVTMLESPWIQIKLFKQKRIYAGEYDYDVMVMVIANVVMMAAYSDNTIIDH